MNANETFSAYDDNAECYRNCHKSLYGFNPTSYPESDSEYESWFAYYDRSIAYEAEAEAAYIAECAAMEAADAAQYAEEQALAVLFPNHHYVPARLADGWF